MIIQIILDNLIKIQNLFKTINKILNDYQLI